MEKILELYKYVDGVNDSPFPNANAHVVITSFRYDAKRMGGSPVISCSVMSRLCLDKLWDYNVYALFNGERYFIKQIPTSSYDNNDSRYKHEIELVSERVILDNVYVYDVVDSEETQDKPVSNSSNFTFFGDIVEFANRLNKSLKYSKVGYSVVVDEGITSEAKLISFKDQFFSNAIQESYNTYDIPYYFVGKVIHFGYTSNAITHTFKYGSNESLLSIQKQNANYKVVNRVTGVGSADNIPYYYPNEYESKEEVEANGGVWVNPQPNLMPSIYRETLGEERFYNAVNEQYLIPNSESFYEFSNPYVDGKPKEHIVNFEDIKPTIVGMTNADGLRIDMFQEFAFDLNDNDETDEEGNYLHPYFFGKLRKFDGEYGFNLFDHSIDESEMTISMTSGSCGGCEFVIGVDDESQKNLVQVDENGILLRDEQGNVRCGREGMQREEPQAKQNDTQNNEVWIALKKDQDSFGVLMPNTTSNYRPKKGDTFVILHIDLPKSYILSAEEKLEQSLIKYMAENNDEKFNFSISFSRIFFAENSNILQELNENARIQIEYNEELYELYVSSYSYAMSNDKPLPEIRVELSDTLTIAQNALQNAISEVKDDILANIGKSQDFLKQGLRYFLRKDKDDRSKGFIGSDKGFLAGNEGKGLTISDDGILTAIIDKLLGIIGIQSKDFSMGEFGNGFILKYENGKSYFEVDEMLVRRVAYFVGLVIKQLSHVGGTLVLSPASMRCSKVEEYEEYYRCYFESERDGKTINQEFVAGDQARAQSFNFKECVNQNAQNQYYWRLVVETGDDYIDLSKIDCDSSSLPPKAGDDIVQLGNRYDSTRQNAIILSTIGEDAPSFKQYEGISTYSLAGKEKTVISPKGNTITGDFVSKTGFDLEGSINDLGVRLDDVVSQTDKTYMIWFYDYEPTLENYPASEWLDDTAKDEHVEDIFYNQEGGRAYRFKKSIEGTYVWVEITDHETIKALEDAAKAQKTADEVTAALNEIVSDGILSSLEKKEVLREWEEVVAAYATNTTNASTYGVDSTAYTNAYKALGKYLNNDEDWETSDTPSWLSDLTTNQEIDASTYRSKWITYYESEKDLLQAISDEINVRAGDAQKAADNAQETADEVTAALNEIVSDGVLSSLEKKEVLKEWEEIASMYTSNVSNAEKYGVDTDDYTSAYKALGKYLNGGADWDTSKTPSWLAALDKNQSIDASEYREKWIAYYDAEVVLLDAISVKLKSLANTAQTSANNAQTSANNAQKTADSKMKNFVVQPVPPYSVGDRWTNAVYRDADDILVYDNDELVCITAKKSGEKFSIDDWQVPSATSSEDRKYFYSEFERLDTELKSVVADGKTQDEAITKANAAAAAAKTSAETAITNAATAKTAADTAKTTADSATKTANNALTTANAASKTATDTATAVVQTKEYVSTIAVAFEVDENGDLVLDDDGSPKLTSSAGSVITSEVAKIYATKTTTNALSSSITQVQSDITAVSDRITALSEKITTDKDGNITNISKSGLVLDTEFATLFSECVTADGIAKTATIKAYVDDKVSKIEITADKIDLTGVITMNMFSDDLKDDLNDTYCKIGEVSADDLATSLNDLINGKADDADLGTLAKKSSVSKDDLSSALKTLIDGKEDSSNIKGMAYYDNVLEALDAQTTVAGGFIKASMIDVDNLYVKNLESTDSYGTKLIASGGKLIMKDKNDEERLSISGDSTLSSIKISYGTAGTVYSLLRGNGLSFYDSKGSTTINREGLYLPNGAGIAGLAIRNYTQVFGSDSDLFIGGGTIELPIASSCPGKIMFFKLTKSSTIKSKSRIFQGNEYNTDSKADDSGYFSVSISGARSLFYINNGTNWYEFTTYYR